MYILGVSCYYHDAAAVLIKDGMLVAAAEEERFSRKKHDSDFPERAINFCLEQAGISSKELDYVVFYEKPLVKFERILLTTLGTFPKSWGVFRESMVAWFNEKLWIKSRLMTELDIPSDKVLFVEHHLCHAASTLFSSPFEEAAVLTIDGVGEWTTATMGRGQADWDGSGSNEIELFKEMKFPHSLGLLYSAFTAYLGFKVNNGEYKVMGMSPYGTPKYLDEVYRLIEVDDEGGFRLNMDYFCFHHSTHSTYNGRFEQLFGPPRDPKSDFYTELTDPARDFPGWDDAVVAENQRFADVAASIQRVAEEVILKMASHAYEKTGLKNLCMAGGVALNSVANGRIVRELPFENVYIQPAAGDSGGALGAALYVYHVLLGQPRRFVLEHGYWGKEFGDEEARRFFDENNVRYEYYGDEEQLIDRVVDAVVDGQVVGWHQGRFEWGPRALGNRSILADPRRAEMKDIVNRKIKFREPFRPFAPVVLAERTEEYFQIPEVEKYYPARFMLLVAPIYEEKQDEIPAVNHLGTGRLQTIQREINPWYYRIVEKFGQATGVPVLMNTSFNLRGEPIVTSPADAYNTFSKSGIDALVVGRYLVTK
jgi:carbamoyltransferase